MVSVSITEVMNSKESNSSTTNGQDLLIQSSDGQLFSVNSGVLRRSSGVFSNMLDMPSPLSSDGSCDPIPLSEHSTVVSAMLDIIDPGLEIHTFARNISGQLLDELMQVADKYEMPKIASMARLIAVYGMSKNTRELAMIVKKYGWQDEIWVIIYNAISQSLADSAADEILLSVLVVVGRKAAVTPASAPRGTWTSSSFYFKRFSSFKIVKFPRLCTSSDPKI